MVIFQYGVLIEAKKTFLIHFMHFLLKNTCISIILRNNLSFTRLKQK